MTLLAKVLLEDAKRRINKKESLPEPEDQMTAPVKKLVQQGVSILSCVLRATFISRETHRHPVMDFSSLKNNYMV